MNRAFPGNAARHTRPIASRISSRQRVFPHAQRRDRPARRRPRGVVPDLHVAASDAPTRRSRAEALAVARLFDTPFVYLYSRQMASGLLTDEAEDEGKIAIGGEFGFGEGSSVRGIAHAYEGVRNVLRHYGMLPGDVTRVDPARADAATARPGARSRRLRAVPGRRHLGAAGRGRATMCHAGQLLGRLHDFADHASAPTRDHRASCRRRHRAALRRVCRRGATLYVIAAGCRAVS